MVIAIPAILIVGGAISQAAYLFSGLTMEGALQALLSQNFQIENIQLAHNISQLMTQISIWLRAVLINLGRSIPGFFTNSLARLRLRLTR